jgi:hypothetical protein
MFRRIRSFLPLLLVAFAMTAAACADTTAPRPGSAPCDYQNNNTCH